MLRLELTLPITAADQAAVLKELSFAMACMGVTTPLVNVLSQEVVATTSTGGSFWLVIETNAKHPGVRDVSIQMTGRGLTPAIHHLLDCADKGIIPYINLTSPGVE